MTQTKTAIPVPIHAKQQSFRSSCARVRGFASGVGAGKSFIGALDILKRAKNGRHYMVLAPTHRVLRDAAWRTFRELANHLGRIVEDRRSPPMEMVISTEDGGMAVILFRSCDDPEHLRGPNLSGIWIDEAAIVSEEVYLIALGRLREGGTLGWLTMTFTPKGRSHWTFGTFYYYDPDYPVAGQVNGGYLPQHDTFLVTAHTRDNPFVDEEFHKSLEGRYSEQRARQELGGEFIDIGSGVVDRAMFGEPFRVAPECVAICRAWDKAGTAGGKGAATAGVKMGLTEAGQYIVLHVARGRWSAIERETTIKQIAESDAAEHDGRVIIVVEQEPGSGGLESCQATIRNLAGHTVIPFKPGGKGSKEERADPAIAQIQAGNVRIVAGGWNTDFLDEWHSVPDGLMDQIDATAMAFSQITVRNQGMLVDRSLVVDVDLTQRAKIAEEIIVDRDSLGDAEEIKAKRRAAEMDAIVARMDG